MFELADECYAVQNADEQLMNKNHVVICAE